MLGAVSRVNVSAPLWRSLRSRREMVAAAGTVLMPSTPFAYPQVISRCFMLFRVVKFSVSAAQRDFCSGRVRFPAAPLPEDRPGLKSPGLLSFSTHVHQHRTRRHTLVRRDRVSQSIG